MQLYKMQELEEAGLFPSNQGRTNMSKKKPHILVNLFIRILVALCSLPLLAFISTTNVSAAAHSQTPQQYLALGDSLAFGFQPNGDFTHGYAVDLFQTLQAQNHFGNFVDLGCPGETSSTFINGTCPVSSQPPPQFATALAYLKQNAGNVGLVTLQIGANDILPAFNLANNCAIDAGAFNNDLATLDQNLHIILPQLREALEGNHPTHLALVEYYNPFQPFCPNTTPFLQELNQHLEGDAEGFAQTVSISDSFDSTNALVCQLTWICTASQDIHPNNLGYQVIANDIYQQIYGNDD